jgi:hypothetical protein
MSAVCPNGHASETTDYCDECGAPIQCGPVPNSAAAAPDPPIQAPPTEILPVVDEADTSPATRQVPCPACGNKRSGNDRYCEACGHDFQAPPPSASGVRWEVLIEADRGQFERFAVPGLAFPSDPGERLYELASDEVRIGKGRGQGERPEIDLAGPEEDPGVSRCHAILERREDGSYALRDLGSTNGTTVNDDPSPVGTDSGVPLAAGDRIRLGVWTTITVRTH